MREPGCGVDGSMKPLRQRGAEGRGLVFRVFSGDYVFLYGWKPCRASLVSKHVKLVPCLYGFNDEIRMRSRPCSIIL